MSEHTPGPWVQFVIDGTCDAIMPAGREGDICTFRYRPTDDDARLMAAAPSLLKALEDAIPLLETLHSLLPMGEARRFAFTKIKNARAALTGAVGTPPLPQEKQT